ncbi:MAG: regulatory protein RecX [Phycisphaerales bacterium]
MNWGSTGINVPPLRPQVRPSLFGDNVPSRDITTAGRISAISPDLKNPTVTFVKVAGQVVARVPFIEVDRLGLRVGATWSSMLAKTCEQVWMTYESRETCIRLMAAREHTSVQLVAKLKSKGVNHDIAHRVVEDLKKEGVVNDDRAAEAIAHSETRKGSASAKVKGKLKAAGAPTDIAVKSDKKQAREAATRLVEKLDGRLAKSTKWRRVMSGLARRGFDEDTARAATRALLGAEPE